MEWSEEDVTEVEKVQTRGQLTLTPARETLRQMMTRTVELAAARGGYSEDVTVLTARLAVLEAERDAARAEAESVACTLRQELADLGLAHNAAVDAFNASKRDHRKALVRARNEGLEKAASMLDVAAGYGLHPFPDTSAAAIRAMKEPEQ